LRNPGVVLVTAPPDISASACGRSANGRLFSSSRACACVFLESWSTEQPSLCELRLYTPELWHGKFHSLCVRHSKSLLDALVYVDGAGGLGGCNIVHSDYASSVCGRSSRADTVRWHSMQMEVDYSGNCALLALWMGFVAFGVSSQRYRAPGIRVHAADHSLHPGPDREPQEASGYCAANPGNLRRLPGWLQLLHGACRRSAPHNDPRGQGCRAWTKRIAQLSE
jgi:hypothetical protein